MTQAMPWRATKESRDVSFCGFDLAPPAAIGKHARVTVKPLGDSAWWVEIPGEAPLGGVLSLVKLLERNRPPGVLDVVSSFASLAVHFENGEAQAIKEWIESALRSPRPTNLSDTRDFEIPVWYQGEDLAQVAETLALTPAEVISLHSGASYTVAAVGFSPGFPYLSGLPERLRIPRRKTPRLAVAGGSVAIAGAQAGIYPFTSPGGWHVLGHTTQALCRLDNSPPALLSPGDRVKFIPVTSLTARHDAAMEDPDSADALIEILQPGALTTVQDLGRPGHEASGVSPGGAVDRESLRAANLLVGNDPGAAALEICVSGPILKFHSKAVVAWLDGMGKSWEVSAGEVIDLSKLTSGVRGYFAVAGGIQVPKVLDSAATDLRAGFGGHHGRALKAGDKLCCGTAGAIPKPDGWHIGRAGRISQIELRYLAGAQQEWFSPMAHARLCSEIYQITPQSDRMGARLTGPPLEMETSREMISQPVACGTIQVPPDGQPIILLAERQTLGGYPQIGHVISADLPQLARAWPGTKVTFREVTWQEAQRLKQRAEREMMRLAVGIELKK